ncbi:streptothricin acetyltransferase [Fictibacillus phosphorivorans]|uniref:Streptothricin acetyltransferase n=1 Tax=Fictibacillus phosphorivorans TaxID=1221500 RepID=A0A168W0V8_9BACL|nr:GNAT family N-acetyltransferase [Fictibacillus phosphorivorans]ANC77315.1 streptothricin acetyltransferase [Fictibacillus phosphorivorans]
MKDHYKVLVGEGNAELDQQLSDELDKVNAASTIGTPAARELTVQILDKHGELAAGMSGWTWGVAAGIAMTWVREDVRKDGFGTKLLHDFEKEAIGRGCTHIFTTSFTFQAPGFYERHGYQELFRLEGLPTPGAADIHFRKKLVDL